MTARKARRKASARNNRALVALGLVLGASALCQRARAHEPAPRVLGEAVRIDGLAAVVGVTVSGPGADVILQSDVELRARLSLASGAADPGVLEPLPNSLLRATLNQLIGEHLIAREATRVQASTPSARDIKRERQRLVSNAGGSERVQRLLSALSASADEIDAIAERRALVGAFLSANLEGVTVVTERELERAYEASSRELAGRSRAQAFAELRTRLSKQALDRTIERWVAVLRTRTPVLVYVQY